MDDGHIPDDAFAVLLVGNREHIREQKHVLDAGNIEAAIVPAPGSG